MVISVHSAPARLEQVLHRASSLPCINCFAYFQYLNYHHRFQFLFGVFHKWTSNIITHGSLVHFSCYNQHRFPAYIQCVTQLLHSFYGSTIKLSPYENYDTFSNPLEDLLIFIRSHWVYYNQVTTLQY